MRFCLTGATGFVGGELARQLVAAGHHVRAVARRPPSMSPSAGIEWFTGDVAVRESLRAPMSGVDGIFHVAGWYKVGSGEPETARQANVEGTRHVLALMRELGIPKGVYTSTLAVNSDTHGRVVDESYQFRGKFISVYEQTKAEAHEIARQEIARGLPLVIVQPGLVYGPGDTSSIGTTLRRFLTRTLPPLPAKTAFCWAHVEDIARGHVLAMERGEPGSYFLSGEVATLVEAMALAERLTGIPAPRLTLPVAVVRAGAVLAGLAERIVSLPPELTPEGLRTLAGTTYLGTAARAERELGWTSRPLVDGLAETLRHEMAALGLPPL